MPQINIAGTERTDLVSVCKKVRINGLRCDDSTALVHNWNCNEEPQIVIINDIVVVNNTKVFRCEKLTIINFVSHLNSFVIKQSR